MALSVNGSLHIDCKIRWLCSYLCRVHGSAASAAINAFAAESDVLPAAISLANIKIQKNFMEISVDI